MNSDKRRVYAVLICFVIFNVAHSGKRQESWEIPQPQVRKYLGKATARKKAIACFNSYQVSWTNLD